jgi:hypothetical protein
MVGRSASALMKTAQMLAAKGNDSMIELAEGHVGPKSPAEAPRRGSTDTRRTCQPHEAELLLRKQLEGSTEIDWDEEKEKIYERLVKATAGLQLDTPIE